PKEITPRSFIVSSSVVSIKHSQALFLGEKFRARGRQLQGLSMRRPRTIPYVPTT
ncbi:hypothetical protein MYU51_017387, partial [Penicillium brevicompactum]